MINDGTKSHWLVPAINIDIYRLISLLGLGKMFRNPFFVNSTKCFVHSFLCANVSYFYKYKGGTILKMFRIAPASYISVSFISYVSIKKCGSL